MNHHSKITTTHQHRKAYIYVRQSTEHQVQHHIESQERQYELADLARSLGWCDSSIEIIDDDQGKSGSGRAGRTGFQRLVSDVALGKAGIVFGLEVSRLARNNRDWYQLLDLCAAKETLIGDADGIYNPSDYNDRLLLGLKGTMSEAELHILKGRMLAGLRHKAAKGKLRFHLSAGYEFDDTSSIVKTSDEQVTDFVDLVFAKLFEIGSVSGVTKFLLHEGLRFPRKAPHDKSVRWVVPYYRAVHTMLTNPIYAGTYVWGRTAVVTELDEDGNRKSRQQSKPMEDWNVVIHDHHPGYISWDQFERIQKIMEQNRPAKRDQAGTAIREGAALLQGIVRCGKCGRSMTVRYHGHGRGGNRTYPYYCCHAAKTQHCGALCQSVGGRRIDKAVARIFLEEMSEASIGIHLVETRWNDELERVRQVERQLEERKRQNAMRLTGEEEHRIKELARDLPKLWSQENVTDKERKSLLRAVLEEVQLNKVDRSVSIKLIWKGDAVTDTTVQLPRVPKPPPTPPDLIALIRELATRYTDAQIARILIRKRIKTPKKRDAFSARHVAGLRRGHGIERFRKRGDEPVTAYTVEQAAGLFGVSPTTIYGWLRGGVLLGEQITAGAPWSITVSDADKKRLLSEAPVGWLPIGQAAARLGVSKQTILNWVKAENIDYVYVTRGRRRGLRINVESAACAQQQQLFDEHP